MKKIVKVLSLLLLAFSTTSVSSCNLSKDPGNGQTTNQEVTGLSFELAKSKISIGEKVLAKNIKFYPSTVKNESITFSVENPLIATVSGNEITGVGIGTTYVVGTSVSKPSISYKVALTVEAVHVSSISLSLNKNEIEIGESCVATVNVLPENATNKDFIIVPSASGYVGISGNVITGKKVGTITLKAKSLENEKMSQDVYITVNPVTARGIDLSAEKTSLEVGQTMQLVYSVRPSDVVDKEVKFKTESGTSNIISVSSDGLVTAKGIGTDYAIAYMKNKPDVYSRIQFTVVAVSATGINLSAAKNEIEAMETVQMIAEVLPSEATNKEVTYATKSGNNNVIKVSKTGLVTGVYPGTETVVCSLKGNPSIKAEYLITVKETPAGSIQIANDNVQIMMGETHQINAQVLPENATDKTLSYSVIDKNSYDQFDTNFISSTDCTINLEKPFWLNEVVNIDVKFNQAATKEKIAVMLGQGWEKYFGYFNLCSDGTLDGTYDGVSVSEVSDGVYRFSFDLSSITKLGDKPAPDQFINIIYIRGVWSTASGSLKVNPEIKNDSLSVSASGLVTPLGPGEQQVRVFLTNHPSIYKDITVKVVYNPLDPIGDDIYDNVLEG